MNSLGRKLEVVFKDYIGMPGMAQFLANMFYDGSEFFSDTYKGFTVIVYRGDTDRHGKAYLIIPGDRYKDVGEALLTAFTHGLPKLRNRVQIGTTLDEGFNHSKQLIDAMERAWSAWRPEKVVEVKEPPKEGDIPF